jgi:ryanodine receptor 2
VASSRALDSLKTDGRSSQAWSRISLDEVIKCLEDLIEYFAQPAMDVEHEKKQNFLKALRNRQDLFQEEVRVLCLCVFCVFIISNIKILFF